MSDAAIAELAPRSAYATPAMPSVSPKPATTAGTAKPANRSGRRRSRTPTGCSRVHCPPPSGPQSSMSCTASGSSTPRRPKCGPHCSTKAATSARSRPSTGCCAKPARAGSAAAGTHPATVKPELVAFEPNQVWSWDITKLRGPAKWSWYYLYVILDIFSRYVVGWMVASRESAALAEVLIRQTCAKQDIGRDRLTIHADRGSSMTSKPVAFLLADLGVTQSHSRPHVSDDNPFSEAQFKTLKYRPDFPDRFDSIEAARRHCQIFFGWYNDEHRHTGLGLHVPADVHYGTAAIIRDKRAGVLNAAYAAHPERFVQKPPAPPKLPSGSWINKPDDTEEATQ
ncbi:integrase core domain protein [Mycobacterium kansasii]|uniref:Integrase core domain protein n=1 Tax=Mycobacterium kansasii TaxID=1768 RepID=A0A1V3W960_MYCKA|nr:integrase core domain protein [Mycobacterium kansasii]